MKKNYKNPTFRQVRAGKIFPIYTDFKNQQNLEGYGRLNHRIQSIVVAMPYVRAEIGNPGDDREPHTIVWSWRRYNVTFVDPWEYDKNISPEERIKYISSIGFTTNRNIAFYLATSSVVSS